MLTLGHSIRAQLQSPNVLYHPYDYIRLPSSHAKTIDTIRVLHNHEIGEETKIRIKSNFLDTSTQNQCLMSPCNKNSFEGKSV